VVETIPGVTAEPQTAYAGPSLIVRWDEAAFKLTVEECAQKLRDGDPRIEVATSGNPSAVPGAREGDPKRAESPQADRIQIIASTLQPGEELLIARRLREVLREARKTVWSVRGFRGVFRRCVLAPSGALREWPRTPLPQPPQRRPKPGTAAHSRPLA
jgi:hypothetical protein